MSANYNLAKSIDFQAFRKGDLYADIVFWNLLNGKNTLQAVKLIASEYVKRFGKLRFNQDQIIRRLQPRGRAVTWEVLDINICQLCKVITQQYKMLSESKNGKGRSHVEIDFEAELIFFDDLRYMLREFCGPKRDRSARVRSENEKSRFDYQFYRCHICWRTAIQGSDCKRTPLCHIHDLNSSDSEYRRRVRMKPRVVAEYNQIRVVTELLKAIYRKYEIKGAAFLQKIALMTNGPLPNLVQYLRMNGGSVATLNEVCDILEQPVYYNKMSHLCQTTWREYRLDFEYDVYEQILLAEAWLRVEKNYRHGGKR